MTSAGNLCVRTDAEEMKVVVEVAKPRTRSVRCGSQERGVAYIW